MNPILIDKHCPVRLCVIDRGLENCAECSQYEDCAKLAERLVVFEQVEDKFGMVISQDDCKYYILPYENKTRLESRRKA